MTVNFGTLSIYLWGEAKYPDQEYQGKPVDPSGHNNRNFHHNYSRS